MISKGSGIPISIRRNTGKETLMGNYEMSALDAYINRAYKIIMILPFTGATTSAFVFTIFRLVGWWPEILNKIVTGPCKISLKWEGLNHDEK